jgi:hypothetical protein
LTPLLDFAANAREIPRAASSRRTPRRAKPYGQFTTEEVVGMSIGTQQRVSRFDAVLARLADARTWISEAPPWAVSLAVHAVFLGLLALISSTRPQRNQAVMVDTIISDDIVQPDFSQTLNPLITDSPIADALALNKPTVSVGQQLGTSSPVGAAPTKSVAALDLDRHAPNLAAGSRGLPTGLKIDQRVSVAGTTDTSSGPGGVAGAIDRLTYEIARSLDDRKTLVIWMLDATASLRPQREEVVKRIDRVYEELGVLKKDRQRALLTAVVAFGEKDRVMTPEPTDDVEVIKRAFREVKDDETGTENVFAAIMDALKRWGKYRTADRRNIMVIALTDERGDDEGKVEEAVQLAKKNYQAKVYVVGAFAPLGRTQVMLPWPGPSQVLGYAPADRGPESARVERDFLPFWTPGGNLDTMPSGFGPWALTRLCRETGGIYFVMQDSAAGFDPVVLRQYQPDYVSRREYEAELNGHPLRKAVIAAAEMTRRMPQEIPGIPLEFPAQDEATLQRNLAVGQPIMAKVQYFVEEPLKLLQSVKAQRDKEPSRRWRAQYDLMLGRLTAAWVRSYTYNGVCAGMKKKPKTFQNKDSNFWILRPDSMVPDDTPMGAKLQDAAEKARQYLNRVVEENPNTPWALLATRELQADLGFRWEEAHRNLAPPGMAANAAAPAPATKPAPPPVAVPKKI